MGWWGMWFSFATAPFLIKCPCCFRMPNSLPISLLTAEFFFILSKPRCSVNLVNCWSVSDLPRKLAILTISPLKSCTEAPMGTVNTSHGWNELLSTLPSSYLRRRHSTSWDGASWTRHRTSEESKDRWILSKQSDKEITLPSRNKHKTKTNGWYFCHRWNTGRRFQCCPCTAGNPWVCDSSSMKRWRLWGFLPRKPPGWRRVSWFVSGFKSMEPYLAGVEQLRVQHVERKVGFDDALLFHVFDLLHSPGHVAHEVVDDLSDHGSHHFSKSVVTEQFHEFAGQWKTRFSTGQNWIDSFSWITWRPARTERNAIIYRAMASLSYLATMGSATKCDILNRNGEKTSEWLNELIKKKIILKIQVYSSWGERMWIEALAPSKSQLFSTNQTRSCIQVVPFIEMETYFNDAG